MSELTPSEISHRMNEITDSTPRLRWARALSLLLWGACCFSAIVLRLTQSPGWMRLIPLGVGIHAFAVSITTYVVAYRRAVKGDSNEQ